MLNNEMCWKQNEETTDEDFDFSDCSSIKSENTTKYKNNTF